MKTNPAGDFYLNNYRSCTRPLPKKKIHSRLIVSPKNPCYAELKKNNNAYVEG